MADTIRSHLHHHPHGIPDLEGPGFGQTEDVVSFAAFPCSDAAGHLSGTCCPSVPLRLIDTWSPASYAPGREVGRIGDAWCDNDGMSRRILSTVLIVACAIAGVTFIARRLGYNLGSNTIVRCRQGHLFTTIWIPGIKLKELDLVVARVQRCPVGKHWSLVVPVRDGDLTDEERQFAREHHDVRIP